APEPLGARGTVWRCRICTWLTAPSALQAQQRFRPKAQETTEAGGDRTIDASRAGMKALMNGNPDQAIKTFQQIQQDDPESAVGYLLEADATWWKIYLTIGNLVDPD